MAARCVRLLVAVVLVAGTARICVVFADAQKQDQQGSNGRAQAQPQPQAKGLDLVSDVVADAFSKTNALLTGNLEIAMERKIDKPGDYTINAIGQRVPGSTAIKSGSSLHNDNPL